MPNIKALIIILSALTLSFLLIGCGLLPSPGAEPEEPETAEAGELPEWLLSEHRTAEREDEEPLKPKEPEEEEADEETAEPEPAQEAAEPEPAEEPAAQEETTDEHAMEAETEEPVEAEEKEPEPEQVTDQRWQRGTYTGKWLDGEPHGKGTYTHISGGKLTGNWEEGTPHGEFTMTAPDGSTETVRFNHGQIAEAEEADDEGEEAWWEPGSGSGGGWF